MCIQNTMGHDKDDTKTQSTLNCVGAGFTVYGLLMTRTGFFASFGHFSDYRELFSHAGPCVDGADVGVYHVESSVYFMSSCSFVLCCLCV